MVNSVAFERKKVRHREYVKELDKAINSRIRYMTGVFIADGYSLQQAEKCARLFSELTVCIENDLTGYLEDIRDELCEELDQ